MSGEADGFNDNFRGKATRHDPIKQLKYLLEKGQTGIDVIGDSPTQACMDPDHPLAVNTVGTQGVSLCCLNDYRELV